MSYRYFLVLTTHLVCTFLCIKVISPFLPGFVTCPYSTAVNLLTYVLIVRFTFQFSKRRFLGKKVQPHNRAVLITGCGHGFGRMLTKQLDSKGFRVFASVRDPSGEGVAELKNGTSKRLEILKLDVKDDASVNDAIEIVKERLGSSYLWAIVNNAGVNKGSFTDLSHVQDFKDCMDINLFGMVRVVKAFLPLLKRSRGRIVNVNSMAGNLPSYLLTVPYVTSKCACIGFTECLRQELDVWGIRVISVEPEIFRTQMTDWKLVENHLDQSFAKVPDDVKDDYGEAYLKKIMVIGKKFIFSSSPNIDRVTDVLESAVSLEYPDAVYRPCRNTATYVFYFGVVTLPLNIRNFIFKSYLYFSRFPIPKGVSKYSKTH